jgi:type II secretory pathway predicted ATPase ExeA
MYEAFYGFKEKPFSMLPDPGFLFLSKKHRAALTLLEYGLLNHVGFCVISGEPGAGKTTILRALLERVPDNVTVGLITNTHQSFGGLLDWVLSAFDLHRPDLTHVEMHQLFMDYLIEEYANHRTVLLIIDEAQNMTSETLEELRMLSNVNSEKDQLLQVMLAGQPSLKDTLSRPELMQFAQRIAVDYHLEPLGAIETCGYIQHRLVTAGAERNIFTPAACERIHCYSGGTPRLINLLCETALVYGFADQLDMIDVDLVDEMVQERMKNSVVPIVNRDAAEKDNKQASKELEQDFPWIKPKAVKPDLTEKAKTSAIKKKPVINQPASQASTVADKPAVTNSAGKTAATDDESPSFSRAKEKPIQSERKTKVAEPPANQPATQQTPQQTPQQAPQNNQGNNVATSPSTVAQVAAGTAKPLVMRAIIAALIISVLIVLALFSSGNFSSSEVMRWVDNKKAEFDGTSALQKQREQEESEVKKLQIEAQALKQQREQEEARVKKLQTEALALQQERDEAIAKAEAEKREKQQAEKAALAAKEAENKRRLEEEKRLAEVKEREQLAKQREAQARAEADRVKREAAKLAEEKRILEARLEEEKILIQQQEAARLEREWLETQRQQLLLKEQEAKIRAETLAETEAAAIAAAKAKEEAESKSAECSGPAARYKASCR